LNLGYEVFGAGDPTVLLMPTWTIIHSRFWKLQVPYLARHYRVVTFDGPGNGHSDRSLDPYHYSASSYAEYALAVLDACGVESAIAVGLSRGAQYALHLATTAPDRVLGVVMVGAALSLGITAPGRESISERFHQPYPENPRGWEKYNLAYWHDHYEDFARFFFDQCFSEQHSTKPIEDTVGWALETNPAVLEAESANRTSAQSTREMLNRLGCPLLLMHGTDDRIISDQVSNEVARITGGTLLSMEGSGHLPLARDPVRFNLALRDFIASVAA
jgi:pimeloyl-ACP methyl ester carboxylesterase